jgi:hypothetical protein
MIPHRALGRAVVAEYGGSCILEFRWHRLRIDSHIKVSKLKLHVHNAFVADRAFVRRLHMGGKAVTMYAVTTFHETNSFWRSKHVVAADRAVTVRRPLDAFVVFFHGDCNAGTTFLFACVSTIDSHERRRRLETYLAVKEILSNASPDPAYATVVAMIYILVGVVVPQLADCTVISGSGRTASHADLAGLLCGSAKHAQHILGVLSDQGVIFIPVMTEAAGIPTSTSRALKLNITPVVFATQRLVE